MSKTIIVTGAGKGIGFEVTKYLSEQSHHVIAISRNIEAVKNIKNVLPYSLDITDLRAIDKFEIFLRSNNVKIDALLNNAGILINKAFTDLSDDEWEQTFNVNLMGPIKLIRKVNKFFNENSHIVNISSMGGYQGSSKFPGLSAYSASKGALSILSECLAVEFELKKIYVNALCLGAVQTEMLETAFPGYDAPVKAKQMGKYIADFILNGHKVINGQVIPVTLSNP